MIAPVAVAGANGDLGFRIAHALVARGAPVRALLRGPGKDAEQRKLEAIGAEPIGVDYHDRASLQRACTGAQCVVSALSGLEDTIVGAQTVLLDAAVAAGVPRFIPSDFSIDFTALPAGSNRNFDLRRTFRERLDRAPIRATSIFNGAFMDMLTGEMPVIQRRIGRILYWQSADQRFATTTKDDTAAFTAAAAMDAGAPRDLHIAGDSVSANDLARLMSDVTGRRFKPLRVGSARSLARMADVLRRITPGDAVFPAWQGMQYTANMFSGDAPADGRDNDRYSGRSWTSVRELLSRQQS